MVLAAVDQVAETWDLCVYNGNVEGKYKTSCEANKYVYIRIWYNKREQTTCSVNVILIHVIARFLGAETAIYMKTGYANAD